MSKFDLISVKQSGNLNRIESNKQAEVDALDQSFDLAPQRVFNLTLGRANFQVPFSV